MNDTEELVSDYLEIRKLRESLKRVMKLKMNNLKMLWRRSKPLCYLSATNPT
jgi:hypothetical protein